MLALIPAAGTASRLRPLTANCPKGLLPLGDSCMLHRTLNALQQHGVTAVCICTGFLAEKIRAMVAEQFPTLHVEYVHNADYETTNNIYSLYLMSQVASGEEAVLLDSDILFDPAILTRLFNVKDNTLALSRHPLSEEEIKVRLDDENRICELSKTCAINDAIGESIGIEKMTADYTHALREELRQMIEKEGLRNSYYEAAFERLYEKGHSFTATDVTDLFAMEIDTIDDYELARRTITHS